ncbi:MAG TPA: hypothetical protein VIM11_00060, partial [Tepidisphaeraceae bacterium]
MASWTTSICLQTRHKGWDSEISPRLPDGRLQTRGERFGLIRQRQGFLSRKASKDYQSTGASINIVAELDQSLLAKPDELQRQIDGLYQQAEEAINRNAAASPPTPPTPASHLNGRATGA